MKGGQESPLAPELLDAAQPPGLGEAPVQPVGPAVVGALEAVGGDPGMVDSVECGPSCAQQLLTCPDPPAPERRRGAGTRCSGRAVGRPRPGSPGTAPLCSTVQYSKVHNIQYSDQIRLPWGEMYTVSSTLRPHLPTPRRSSSRARTPKAGLSVSVSLVIP